MNLHGAITRNSVSAGRCRRIDRLPHGRSLLASSSISRWQLGPQRGVEEVPRRLPMLPSRGSRVPNRIRRFAPSGSARR